MTGEAMDHGERKVIKRLLTAALARGYVISVNDGEAWALKVSGDLAAILSALGHTDEEYILIRDAHRKRIGTVMFVYGNSPEEVLADYSDNDETRVLVEAAEAVAV